LLYGDISHVDFKFVNNFSSDIDDSNLFLFFHSDGNYYAFSKNQTTEKISEVYIIPEKTIEYVKILRIV
jgi:hypothetical protein